MDPGNLCFMGEVRVRPAVCLLLLAATALADPVSDAVETVLAAAKEGKPLKEFAAKDEPDPWVVAEMLCARGEFDAAEAFAKAAPRTDTERLPAYVAAQGAAPTDVKARDAIKAIAEAIAAKDYKAALALPRVPVGSVVSIRILGARALALRATGRLRESAEAYAQAGAAAEKLGWLRRAASSYSEAGMSAAAGRLNRLAFVRWRKHLALDQLRKNRPGIASALNNLGTLHAELGRFGPAKEHMSRSLAIQEKLGNRAAVATTILNLGRLHASHGHFAEGIRYLKDALRRREQLKDRDGVVGAVANLGEAYARWSHPREAVHYFERHLALARESADRRSTASALRNLGNMHAAYLDRPREAIRLFEESLRLSTELGDRRGVAGCHDSLGGAYMVLNEHDKALASLQRALRINSEFDDPSAAAITRSKIGVVHRKLGNWKKAIAAQEAAILTFRERNDPVRLGKLFRELGACYRARGHYDKALEYYRRSIDVDEKTGHRLGVADAYHSMGFIHFSLARYDQALACARRSARLWRELDGYAAGLAAAQLLTAQIHRERGNYAVALDFCERARQTYDGTGAREGLALSLAELGTIQHYLGQHDKALGCYERALAEWKKLKRRVAVAWGLSDIAMVYASQGRYGKAMQYARRALEIQRELSRLPDVARSLSHIAASQIALRRLDQGLELLGEARRIHEELGDRAGAARAVGDMGRVYMRRGDFATALKHLQHALSSARARGITREIRKWAGSVGRALSHGLNRPADAIPYFEEAIAAIESERDAVRGFSQATRAAVVRELRSKSPYLRLMDAHLRLGNLGAALEAAERGRAREILDLLARSRFDPLLEAERRAREQRDEKRVAAIAKQRADLAAADRQVGALTYALSVKQTDQNRSELAQRLKGARTLRSEILDRRARLVRDLVPAAKPASLATIQAALKPNERMLYYTLSERPGVLFLVPPMGGKIEAFRLKPREQLEAAVRSHLAAIVKSGRGSRGVQPPPGDEKTAQGAGKLLASWLFPTEKEEKLNGFDRLYIVPHGILHQLPFESLPRDLPPLVYCHSASVLLWCKERRKAQQAAERRFEVVALGDPVFSRGKGADQPPEQGVLVVRGKGALEAGDVVLAYDGRPVGDAKALRTQLRRVEDEVEDKGIRDVKLRVWRAGREIDLVVKPGALGIDAAREPPRVAWKKMRSESVTTLQRGADRFGALKRLPGTRREIESIRRTLGEKSVKALLGEEATKANLFALAPMGRYLHLATHQLVDETERRGYSRLALTRPRIATPNDDGFLSLFELLDSWRDRLSACELVVLSACETLKGPMQKDEGPYAMPLGFLYAGAPAVIGSLWRVDDASTAELFADFYRRLAKGTPKLQAFTEARRALRKKYGIRGEAARAADACCRRARRRGRRHPRRPQGGRVAQGVRRKGSAGSLAGGRGALPARGVRRRGRVRESGSAQGRREAACLCRGDALAPAERRGAQGACRQPKGAGRQAAGGRAGANRPRAPGRNRGRLGAVASSSRAGDAGPAALRGEREGLFVGRRRGREARLARARLLLVERFRHERLVAVGPQGCAVQVAARPRPRAAPRGAARRRADALVNRHGPFRTRGGGQGSGVSGAGAQGGARPRRPCLRRGGHS